MAEGGKITPLPSDTAKSGTNIADMLRPMGDTRSYEDADSESESSSMMNAVDGRSKGPSTMHPADLGRMKLSSYGALMHHMFGTMANEITSHINGEVTADKTFEDAMHPLA
jgi:hypothetical protein